MANKKILLISFFFEPHCGVGAFRASYWAKNLKAFGYDVSVITTTKVNIIPNSIDNIFRVPYNGEPFLVDQGFEWGKEVKTFLNKNTLPKFDVILLTGGPFMQFFLLSKLKKKWPSAKLIIDYRDPNSNNPRSELTKISSIIKNFFKRVCDNHFLKNADLVLTTNKFFAEFIDPFNRYSQKIFLIENGFDELCLDSILKQKKSNKQITSSHLVYPGPFTSDRIPLNLFEAIKNLYPMYHLHHVGAIKNDLKLPISKAFHYYGLKPYKNTLELIDYCDIGIILAGANEIGATTKLFDYIGLSKTILIITSGELNFGTLEDVTKNYPKTYWSKNDANHIALCLKKIHKDSITIKKFEKKPLKDQYSRKSGLIKLVKIIERK